MATLAINIDKNGKIKQKAGATHFVPEIVADGNEYTISGVVCLASEGWQMSIPTGNDGHPLFTVSCELIEDGVKIITSDAIPDGRVLTLRFDVPDIDNDDTQYDN